MPVIITRLSDESVAVRDTAAWFVGRACDIVPETAINENYFEHLLQAMVAGKYFRKSFWNSIFRSLKRPQGAESRF